jgi:hypothetical protein
VTADDLIEALLKNCRLQVAFETKKNRTVVKGIARLKLIDEPHALLAVRKWYFPISGDGLKS